MLWQTNKKKKKNHTGNGNNYLTERERRLIREQTGYYPRRSTDSDDAPPYKDNLEKYREKEEREGK